MSEKQVQPATFISITDTNSVKFYSLKGDKADGLRYATASNWRAVGKMPKDNAIASEILNSLGQSFTVYAENQLTDYDAKAEAKAKEKRKELKANYKAEVKELFDAFKAHKIDGATYGTAYEALVKRAEADGINLA